MAGRRIRRELLGCQAAEDGATGSWGAAARTCQAAAEDTSRFSIALRPPPAGTSAAVFVESVGRNGPQWNVTLLGPPRTPYAGGVFNLSVDFPGAYPFKEFKLRFTTQIYHVNVHASGTLVYPTDDQRKKHAQPLERPVPRGCRPIEPLGDHTITVLIKKITGNTTALKVEPSNSIADIKERIWDSDGIPSGMQRLIFAGKNLEDGRTLSDYTIVEGDTLHMVMQLRCNHPHVPPTREVRTGSEF